MNDIIIFDLDDTLYDKNNQLTDDYNYEDIDKITPFPGVIDFLSNHPSQKILVTKETEPEFQNKKIEILKIKNLFDKITVCHSNLEKKRVFSQIMESNPNLTIWVVGDRINSEIRYGNELGFQTVLLKTGKYKNLRPKDKYELPNYEINQFNELKEIIT